MAAIEQLLISKVITDKEVNEVVQLGVKPQHFGGHYAEAWEWIVEYTTKHGGVPTERAFSLSHSDIVIEDTSAETTSGLVAELVDQFRQEKVAQSLSEATAALNGDDTAKALQVLSEGLREASAETLVLKDTDLVGTWAERYAEYKRRHDDDRTFYGTRTGFPTLDAITGGFKNQQFILWVGEPKRGKSLFSLISAQAANGLSNKKVLYVSFEMSAEEVGGRYDALYAHVPFNDLLNGTLNRGDMDRVEEAGLLRKHRNPFVVSEDQSRLTTVAAIRAKALDLQPDLIVIDGMYMMQDDGGEEEERKILTKVTRATKRLAQELNIPIIGTTQVLSGKVTSKSRKIESHSIGYTGSFVQDADLIIGCELDPDVPDQTILRIVEARNAAKGAVIKVQWDWSTMHFDEVGYEEDGDSHDDFWDHD